MIGALRNAYSQWQTKRATNRRNRAILIEMDRILTHEIAYRALLDGGGLELAEIAGKAAGVVFRQAQENSNVHGT